VSAGAETYDTGAEASWQGHSRMVGADVRGEIRGLVVFSNHSALLFSRISLCFFHTNEKTVILFLKKALVDLVILR